jgi:hypothetical protein
LPRSARVDQLPAERTQQALCHRRQPKLPHALEPRSRLADERITREAVQELGVVGVDGEDKMSKSRGNYIGINEPPEEMFGKTMSIPDKALPQWWEMLAGGGPPQGIDFLDRSYQYFPWLVAAVLVLTYLLLMRAFRSIVLPLKAVLLNLLSVGASYGALVIVFKWGLGKDLLGLYKYSQLEGWIPIFLFAMLFGLSMDYEVFLVTRMREAWDEGEDNAQAVAHGLERTGRIVTAAAIVMVAAFSGFVAGSILGLQEFGLGLAVAIFVDATIVRAILVPSLMALFGRYNWWLPDGLAKFVRVPPSPLERHPPPALRPAGE